MTQGHERKEGIASAERKPGEANTSTHGEDGVNAEDMAHHPSVLH